MDDKTRQALAAAEDLLAATEDDEDDTAVIALSLEEASRDHRRIMKLGDIRVLFALAAQANLFTPGEMTMLARVVSDSIENNSAYDTDDCRAILRRIEAAAERHAEGGQGI